MEYRFRINQDDLSYLYNSAQARIKAHPEFAEKQKKVIQEHTYFKTEKEALESTISKMKDNNASYQIWAKTEKEGNIIRIQDYWITTDDNKVKLAADYLGMALIYDTTKLQNIIDDNVKIDNVIAYD